MDSLFSEMADRHLITSGKVKGKPDAVFGYFKMLQNTGVSEVDREWWQLRAKIIAHDGDQQAGDLPLMAGLAYRKN